MLNLQADTAAVCFADFAQGFARVVGGVQQAAFGAILSHPSKDALDGYHVGPAVAITYPASTPLAEGDALVQLSTGAAYTVREPRAIGLGLHCTARLEARA